MSAICLKCRIAELDVEISLLVPENRLIKQADKYISDKGFSPDFKIALPKDFLQKRAMETPGLPLSETEYIWTGYEFCRRLLEFDGFVLHASAVLYKGKVYLFSAPSGTGKSTHAALWEKVFGSDAVVINDDKPALRLIDGKLYVFGTPWSGKSDKNKNLSAPLGGICFISQSETNYIEKADTLSSTALILGQTLRYPSEEFMTMLLNFLDKILPGINVFKMQCNMDDEAAIMAYEFMNNNMQGDNFYEN